MRHVIRICGVIIAIALLSGGSAGAREGWELGTEVYYFKYEEPDFMEDTGVFVGVNTRYTTALTVDERSMLRLEGRFAYGQVDYTSESTGEIDNIDDFVVEARLLGGYVFGANAYEVDLNGDDVTFTPYLGIGYRYLNDDTGGEVSTTGHLGYERESNYLYLPIGADLQGPVSGDWSFIVNAEFDVFLWGRQESHLGDVSPVLGTVKNDQESGWGARGSVRLVKANENTDLFIEPFVRYWHIDDSEISPLTAGGAVVGYGLEPENNTIEAGAKLGLRF